MFHRPNEWRRSASTEWTVIIPFSLQEFRESDWYLDQIKDVIQDLFQIQSATHGYAGPQTQQELVRLMYETYISLVLHSL